MNTDRRWTLNAVLVMAAGLLFTLPLIAQEADLVKPQVTVATVHWLEDTSEIPGTEAVLTRMEHGIAMTLDTKGLEPGYVYTIWWMIFDVPENCSNNSCGLDDVYVVDDHNNFVLNGDGGRILNRTQNSRAKISAQWAAGSIVDERGEAYFEGHLPIGDLTADTWFGRGLTDPMTAEIHLITRRHGPPIPELLNEQMYTFTGGCDKAIYPEGCVNNQVVWFDLPG